MKKLIQLLIVTFVFTLFTMSAKQSLATWQYRASSANNGSGTGNLSVTKPTGTVQGDLIIAVQTATLSTSSPDVVDSGWTALGPSTLTTGCCVVRTYYRIAGSSEPASYTFSFTNNGTSNQGVTVVTYYRDDGGGIALDGTVSTTEFTASTTSFSATGVTTTGTDRLIVGMYGADGTGTANYQFSSTDLTIRKNVNTNTGVGAAIGDVVQSAQGASGNKLATIGQSDIGRGVIAAFQRISPPGIWYSSNVSPTSYSLGGLFDPSGIQSYGYFRYGTTSPGSTCSDSYGTRFPTSSASDTNLGSGVGTQYYNQTVTGLTPSTTYYWCAMARDGSSNFLGSSSYSTFTTDASTPITTTYPASSVLATTASLNGTSNPHTYATTGWFRAWTSNPGSCSDTGGTRFPAASGTSIGTGSSDVFYKQAATGLIAGQQYWYCAISSNANGTTYGALNTFTTAASISTGCTLMPGSTITDGNDEAFMQTYLSNYKGTLIYKATTNGWTAGNFHTAADNQGPTLTVIKNSINNVVFGGYNSFPWGGSGYKPGDEGFLFNLTNNYRLTNTNSAYQTYNNASYGPTFGGGHDLGMPNSTLNQSGVHYTNTNSYQNPNTQGAYTYLDGGGGSPSAYNFTPSEIEVYKLTACTSSVPTVTTPTSASITVTSATLGGNVTSAGTASITARGICYAPTATDSNPRIGDSGVTCTPEGATTTGVFTVAVSNLLGNTAYSYNAYATNSVGTSYVLGTFSTVNPSPTTVGTSASGTPQSYYVTLNGSANPNGYQTYGHFRVFDYNPGNCNSDAGGAPAGNVNIRYPEGTVNFPDLNLGSGTSVVSAPTFSYAIPLNASNFLTPNTTYYYCAYAINTVSSTNYTTGASAVSSFTTPDGPANPCDPPSSGSLSIPSGAACNFVGTVGGVDAGSGTRNTALLTIPSGTRLSIGAGQKIAFGSISLARGALMTIARGGSLSGGGVYVHDNDRDNYLDDATQYVGSTASAATEFIRRNTISSIFNYSWKIASSGATFDCNKNSAYAYRVLPNLIRDADNDGYKTSTAAGPQCVGAAGTFNGRTYYNDGSGPN